MNAFEINKIVGAVLVTVLVASIISFIGNILVPEGGGTHAEHKPAATDKKPVKTAAPATPKPQTPLANLLAQGDAGAGGKLVRKCTACHSFDKGGANKIGPNLYGVVGRKKGSHPGYSYSAAMKSASGVWSYADLNAFLTKPGAFIKGTKMPLRIAKPEARANLLLYLRTLSDSPVPLPKPAPVSGGGGTEKKAEAGKKPAEAPKKTAKAPTAFAAALAAGDAARGAKLAARKCKVCHSFKAGGPNKIGPNLYGVVGRNKGSHPGYSYSAPMKSAGGVWSYADLNAFLTKPGAFIKGTKMGFRIAKPEARANLLLYLRTLSDSPVPLPKPAPVSGGGGTEKKAEAGKKPAEAPKKTAKAPTAFAAALAAGDAARGAKLAARKCKVCHSFKAGGPNKFGPNLYGVVGRARASHEGYQYSKAMKAKGGAWSPEEINIFLTNPGKFVKGTKMPIKIGKPGQRADIIAYLKTLSGK